MWAVFGFDTQAIFTSHVTLAIAQKQEFSDLSKPTIMLAFQKNEVLNFFVHHVFHHVNHFHQFRLNQIQD
jgi:hypothetical protein